MTGRKPTVKAHVTGGGGLLGAAIVPTLLVREGDVGALARSDAVAARLRAFGVEPV